MRIISRRVLPALLLSFSVTTGQAATAPDYNPADPKVETGHGTGLKTPEVAACLNRNAMHWVMISRFSQIKSAKRGYAGEFQMPVRTANPGENMFADMSDPAFSRAATKTFEAACRKNPDLNLGEYMQGQGVVGIPSLIDVQARKRRERQQGPAVAR